HPFGGYADYVTIDATLAVPLPDALSFEDATALMVQGLTAFHLLRQSPPAGKSVLVTAAAGGVGSLLVQLARR
ncbi:MAG: zinc-binding alcohol dehydrogenase family protein, partial [Mesorhizobium sp.]